MKPERLIAIRRALEARFSPEYLEVEDESHLHEGHAGAQSGKGHFRVTVVAEAFRDMPPLKRHQAIYEALGPLMETDIHALTIRVSAPDEF